MILAAFHIETDHIPTRAGWYKHDMDLEIELDDILSKELNEVQIKLSLSADNVEKLVIQAGIEIGGVDDESDEGEGGEGENDIEMISNNPIREQRTLSNATTSSNNMMISPNVRDFSSFQSSTVTQMKRDSPIRKSTSPHLTPKGPTSNLTTGDLTQGSILLRKPTWSESDPTQDLANA